MKRFIYTIATIVVATVMLGCQTDPTTTPIAGENVTTLSISLEPSRTSLGVKEGDTYPVFWSENDRIVMNGVASQVATIDATNKSVATFTVPAVLNPPYSITYPYTEGLAESKVLFLSEQPYTAGTFAQNSTPMCGYTNDSDPNVQMKHLTGILRLPVKAANSGAVLEKIVITSLDGVKLAGEFDVNCTNATITASANAVESITYTLPANFTLSTTTESVFHIAVPAVEIGACQIDFIEASGDKMTRTLSNRTIKPGVVREFKTITHQPGVGGELEALDSYEDEFEIYYDKVYGYVKDTNGNPIAGVAVSNGFQVVATNANGYYEMSVTPDTWYIYISTPAEYKIDTNEYGQPCFYKPYPTNTPQYDFTLTPLEGGKEEKFALFAIGDPQVRNSTQLSRFNAEAVPALLNHSTEVKAQGIPCYGITLGDIIANSNGTNTESLRDDMRDGFHPDKAGMIVYQTYGNHDNTYYGDGVVITTDKRSSTIELAAQRGHEAIFGPVDYSFNRGDIHIVSMRNIIYRYSTTSGSYLEGFLPAQYEWLKQDLALVPKDKMVILCVHAPLFRNTGNYVEEVLTEINKFKEAHVISGHTHISHYYDFITEDPSTPYPNVFEHNVGALCGVWWRGNIAADGAPTGYNVFVCEGNEFTESYFMGINEGLNNKEIQMRLHRGNAITGRAKLDTDTYENVGYYAFNFGEDVLIANVYYVDRIVNISVYEDDVYSGEMVQIGYGTKPTSADLVGDRSLENPRRMKDGLEYAIDMYTAAFYYNYYSGRSAWSDCTHLYKYQLKNKDANIKVVLTDRYGKTYTQTKITEGTDYSLVAR
ncbi:MAG: calcineurin-like phosphoesterase C-terminal domain-containing protein [Alistipes sp.]|nr:calcineurin-like phosphoesterase C-terminal domain-containing protein [Alistipes sp.]